MRAEITKVCPEPGDMLIVRVPAGHIEPSLMASIKSLLPEGVTALLLPQNWDAKLAKAGSEEHKAASDGYLVPNDFKPGDIVMSRGRLAVVTISAGSGIQVAWREGGERHLAWYAADSVNRVVSIHPSAVKQLHDAVQFNQTPPTIIWNDRPSDIKSDVREMAERIKRDAGYRPHNSQPSDSEADQPTVVIQSGGNATT